MGPSFVQEVAPELALRGRFTESEAGLAGPEYMYDSRGNPLNWIQNEGGVRQFYVPEGEQAFSAPPVQADGLRGRTPQPVQELAPNAGLTLRGRVPMASAPQANRFQLNNTPIDTANPEDLLRRRSASRTQRLPPPVSPSGDIEVTYGRRGPNVAPRVPVPGEDMRNENRSPNTSGLDLPEGATIGDMLRRIGIRLPNIRFPDAGTGEASASTGLRGRSAVDVQPASNPRALNNFNDNGMPRFDTPEAVAEFNQATGFDIRPNQVRTQAEQDALVARGRTRSRDSYHIPGLAADIPASQLNGLTGAQAEEFVRNRLQAAGYPVNNMDIVYESGRGRNQGTGAHVHIEPNAPYRRQ